MEKNNNTTQKPRDALRNRLKGTLSAWKLDSTSVRDRIQSVDDRTPEPGITDTQFEDSFILGRKIGYF